MTHTEFVKWLKNHEACKPARDWVRINAHTPATAWEACVRPDWMIWLAREAGIGTYSQHVRCATVCARAVLPRTRDCDRDVCVAAIEAAEKCVDDDPSEANYAAARAADAADAADAAYAAYAAARAAADAADAASRAARAADAAARAAYAADAAYVAAPSLRRDMADAVRGIILASEVVI